VIFSSVDVSADHHERACTCTFVARAFYDQRRGWFQGYLQIVLVPKRPCERTRSGIKRA
jgi:hypothetical protein